MWTNVVFILIYILIGIILGSSLMILISIRDIKNSRELSEKHLSLLILMCNWFQKKQEGISIASILSEQGYKNIAVYGMSHIGMVLVNELSESEVNVKCGIDNKKTFKYKNLNIVQIKDCPNDIDAIVVTAITFFEEIEKGLSEKFTCPILSIEALLDEV